MTTVSLRRVATATLATAGLVGALVVAAPSAFADTPPYEPDPSAVGTITFYDASGAVVTSGSSSHSPFAAYAVGTAIPRAGDQQAELIFANPDPNSPLTSWYKEAVGAYTKYPLTTGPSSVQTLSQTRPVVAVGAKDNTPDAFEDDSNLSTAPGYAGNIQVRLVSANALGQPASPYDVADIHVNGDGTWSQVFPATSATAPGAPTAVTATAGNASATVSWTAPAANGGSPITGYDVKYSADDGANWTTVTRTGTATSQAIPGLTNGTPYVFEVAAVNAIGESTFTESNAVTPAAPPADNSSLSIAATKAVAYGKAITVTGTLKDTTTGKAAVGYTLYLQSHPTTSSTWKTISSAKTNSAGTATLSIKPTATTSYHWVYTGSVKTLKAATSATAVTTVSQVLTSYASHTAIKSGQSVSLYGTVAPSVTNARIYLQELSGKTWKTVSVSGVIKKQKFPNGKTGVGYVLTIKLNTRASYQFRAYAPATKTIAAGYSAAHALKVS